MKETRHRSSITILALILAGCGSSGGTEDDAATDSASDTEVDTSTDTAARIRTAPGSWT